MRYSCDSITFTLTSGLVGIALLPCTEVCHLSLDSDHGSPPIFNSLFRVCRDIASLLPQDLPALS